MYPSHHFICRFHIHWMFIFRPLIERNIPTHFSLNPTVNTPQLESKMPKTPAPNAASLIAAVWIAALTFGPLVPIVLAAAFTSAVGAFWAY